MPSTALNFTYRVNPRTTSAKNLRYGLYMTMQAGSGLGNNDGNDFKKKRPDDWCRVRTSCQREGYLMVPGSLAEGRCCVTLLKYGIVL